MPLSDNFMENYRFCCAESKTRLKVKSLAKDKCLDFNADRLDEEDWSPLMKALRSDQRLHTLVIKSEYPGKHGRNWVDRPKPAFHKPVVVDELIESIAACMKHSDILSTVQLQSLPLTRSHVEMLAAAIGDCTSLQNLRLTRFELNDDGLNVLYESIYPHIGLNVIDFTGCGLTSQGAQTVAKIIRIQRLARFDETWKQSLRYREPNPELFPGIRRITLNDNPNIGDDGYKSILHELFDDLWVKAIDVQNCGLTSISATESIELIKINNIISVLDLTRNYLVPNELKKRIKKMLIEKRKIKSGSKKDHDAEDMWLGKSSVYNCTKRDLPKNSNSELSLNSVNNLTVDNCLSSCTSSFLPVELHQTKRKLDDTKRHLIEEKGKRETLEREKQSLAQKFTKEWNKRKQIEKQIERLKKKLHGYNSVWQIPKTKNRSSLASTSQLKTGKSRKQKVAGNDSSDQTKQTSSKSAERRRKTVKVLEGNGHQTNKSYNVCNTQQVHVMQQNLDKLNLNESTPKLKSPRDMSPISRSQYIFKNLMLGKSRTSYIIPNI